MTPFGVQAGKYYTYRRPEWTRGALSLVKAIEDPYDPHGIAIMFKPGHYTQPLKNIPVDAEFTELAEGILTDWA